MSSRDIDLSAVPLNCFQSGPLRSIIDTEFSIAVLDVAGQGKDVSVVQEQAIRETLVPAIFFRAVEEGFVTQNVVSGIVDVTADFVVWVRTEVHSAVFKILGLET